MESHIKCRCLIRISRGRIAVNLALLCLMNGGGNIIQRLSRVILHGVTLYGVILPKVILSGFIPHRVINYQFTPRRVIILHICGCIIWRRRTGRNTGSRIIGLSDGGCCRIGYFC